MNKDIFHNQLALNLGYQRIVNDKRIIISIDDKQYPDDVMVSISVEDILRLSFKASEGHDKNDIVCLDDGGCEDVKTIVDAVHQAYLESTRKSFK